MPETEDASRSIMLVTEPTYSATPNKRSAGAMLSGDDVTYEKAGEDARNVSHTDQKRPISPFEPLAVDEEPSLISSLALT